MSSARLFPAYQIPTSQRPSRAALVPEIRKAVHGWRRQGYPGATPTSVRLLRHWFETDHLSANGEEWHYYYCQREAIETIIYLYEVMQTRKVIELYGEFAPVRTIAYKASDNWWARYVCKMATGSGKTKVMSLAVVWSYFNARFETDRPDDYAKTFALIAPNVIVYQRLLDDFRDGKIFREDPLIPPEWKSKWQFAVVTRDDAGAPGSDGTLYLTNIHQLYPERESTGKRGKGKEPAALTAVLGGPRPTGSESAGTELRRRILSHGDLMVFNDEGHHVHTDDLVWSQVIEGMHTELERRTGVGLRAQLDFSATPKHNNGALFQEVIVDYPIAAAVDDGIVKRPIIGELQGALEYASDDAANQYRDHLTAGIEKWKEACELLEETDRNPLLFVMTADTKSADEIGDWLKQQPDFSPDSVLVIHTNRQGEISMAKSKLKELDELREASRRVDEPNSPYKAIVSVLMLREGWDVRNVCVIVPLRKYSAKSEILPEQTMGRGLRRMWPVASGNVAEQLIIIEHEAFNRLWKREMAEEDLDIEILPVEQVKFGMETIVVDPDKLEYDIEIPVLTPGMETQTPDWDQLDVHKLPKETLAIEMDSGVAEDPIKYTGRDWLSLEIVDEAEFERDFPVSEVGFLNLITRLILRECRLQNLADTFAQVAPRVRTYIEEVMCGGMATMADDRVLVALNRGDNRRIIFNHFVTAIRGLQYVPRVVEATGQVLKLSDTPAYTTSRQTITPRKSVFNLAPCDMSLEYRFAGWLNSVASDVDAWAKNEPAVRFTVEYIAPSGAMRIYRPDYIVRAGDQRYVIETKGLETIEVPAKDKRIREWCRAASELTGTKWRYVKVTEGLFQAGNWNSVAELYRASSSELAAAGD